MREFILVDAQSLPESYDPEALGAQPIVELKESEQRIDITYRFPGFFRNDQEHEVGGQLRRFDGIEIFGVGTIAASGNAQLPSFGRYVQVPVGCNYYPGFNSARLVRPKREVFTVLQHP